MDETSWKRFLNDVGKISISIEGLLRVSKPVDFDGDKLKIGVYYKFHKDKLEENKNKLILENVLNSIFNKNIQVEYLLSEVPVKAELTDVKNENIISVAEQMFS